MTGRHYLVVRPLASRPEGLEEELSALADLTGLDGYTLRQKLVGTALETLATGTDPAALRATADTLRSRGVSAWLVGKEQIVSGEAARRCTRLELRPDALGFVGTDRGLITALDRGDPCLLVLGALDFRSFQQKLMARRALRVTDDLSLGEVVRSVCANDPVLDLYLPGDPAAVRIHGRRFDFTCLGECNRLAIGANFPTVLEDLLTMAGEIVLDTGFGTLQHPFLDWPEPYDADRMLRQFQRYSRFVRCIHEATRQNNRTPALSPLAPLGSLAPLATLEPSGVLWTAVRGGGELAEGARGTEIPASDPAQQTLPPPPVEPGSFVPASPLSWGALLDRTGGWYLALVRSLGAPRLLQPLIALGFGAFALAWMMESLLPVPAGVVLLGVASFVHSFVLQLRKRAIQNCPTARLRSMPMGEMEVKGRAAQKYHLTSPYTSTDCVYYSYEVYTRATGRDQAGFMLTESGHSGRVPFYLEDGPHRVLVLPEKAVLHAGTAQTLHGDGLGGLGALGLGLGRPVPADGKVVERVIAAGDELYVMGYARRIRHSDHDQRQQFRDKLRELKADRGRMRQYDLDGDGHIDSGEWARAREAVEEEALLEGLGEDRDRDEVAIGEHPAGGLFYISDRREEAILGSLTWQIPVAFAAGVAGIVGGGYTLVQTLVGTGWWAKLTGG